MAPEKSRVSAFYLEVLIVQSRFKFSMFKVLNDESRYLSNFLNIDFLQ